VRSAFYMVLLIELPGHLVSCCFLFWRWRSFAFFPLLIHDSHFLGLYLSSFLCSTGKQPVRLPL
jgi:hypothetical protein